MSESNGKPHYHIFLAVPNAGNLMPCCLTNAGQASREHRISLAPNQFGDIPHNFNMLWCGCLNGQAENGFTHFAMMHTDIRFGAWWLDGLLAEMDRVDADVMSAIVAIKDARGLTTTGLRRPGVWGTHRFTMKEVMTLPETFSIEDLADVVDSPHQTLAINTGCWVCRFPVGGWPVKFPGFQNEHRIRWRGGQAEPEFDSEDWLFSDWLASQGLRVYATRSVLTGHVGAFEFDNNSPWGSLQTDEWRPRWPSRECEFAEAERLEEVECGA